ncbi:MAG: hypothetical protein DMG97_31480, partial [Acidobacteria bacterium]
MNRALPVAKFTAIALTLVCLIALPSAYLAAQATGGTIVGTVIDSTGAAVANADVEARSVGTNVAATAKTGDTGLYRFDNLLPGAYKITAKASGFKTISQTA